MQVTFDAVNAAIKKHGGTERLVQVGSLFAFTDGTSANWMYRMVHARNLQDFSLEQWMAHWERLRCAVRV